MRTSSSARVAGCLAVLVGLGSGLGRAEAGPRRKRAPRPELVAAVASGDAALQCKAAIAAVDAGDAARAALVLPACDDPAAAAPVDDARRARQAVARIAERQDWSPVELVVRPAGAVGTLTIDAFPGLPVSEGSHLLPAGTYRITGTTEAGAVTYDLTLAAGSRALVLVELPTGPAITGTRVLDLGDDDSPAAPPMAGPPPIIKRGSLLPERFRRGLGH